MSDPTAILRELADSFTPFSVTWRAMTEAAEAIDTLLRERGELADAINAIDALVPGEAPLVERVRGLVASTHAADVYGEAEEDRENEVINDDGALIASPWHTPEPGTRVRSYYDDLAGCVDEVDGWRARSCMGKDAQDLRGPETGAEGEAKVDAALAAWGVDLHQTDVWWFVRHKDEA